MPRVSVLIPVYNAARYLDRALASVSSQTERDLEIIVVDDGSTDRSLAILQKYARSDSRMRIVSRPNTGIVGALNDGLAHCNASWVARMDADDWSAPARLEKQLAYLAIAPGCVALGSWVMFCDPEGRPLKRYETPLRHQEIEAQLCEGNGGALIHPSGIFSREAIAAVGGYRGRSPSPEDLDLYVRLLERGRLGNLPEVLHFYRLHHASVTNQPAAWEEFSREIVRELRERHGLGPLPAGSSPDLPTTRPDRGNLRRRWALYAAEGGHLASAWPNLARALLHRPWERENFSVLGYLLHLAREAATSK